MCSKNRIVVFLGAGFPVPWGAPSSMDLENLVKAELQTTSYSFLTERFAGSFEDILAALYSYATFPLNHFRQELYQVKCPEGVIIDDATALYLRCINVVMAAISDYESKWNDHINQERNQHTRELFDYLGIRYKHISVYTTNYDECLLKSIGWDEDVLSLKDGRFIYAPLRRHKLHNTYSNLHGSIHLQMNRFGGQQYEMSHSPLYTPLFHLHQNYGGNPHEFDLFTPIIVGHDKTQQVLSKHFNYLTTCFANDLSDCDTFLAVGCSFGDPHLNALIRQYTLQRNVIYRIVTKEAGTVCNTIIDNNISAQILDYRSRYSPDKPEDDLFIREEGRLVYYKRGSDDFLSDKAFWKTYL